MRIQLFCSTCMVAGVDLIIARRAGAVVPPESIPDDLVDVILNEQGVYRDKCAQGHDLVIVVFNPKHELLFDLGALALLDGYHREAVVNFAAALERFYEFHIRVLMVTKLGADPARVAAAWKDVSKQSERQLGAFVFTALTAYGEPVDVKPVMKHQEFRNKVVHNGAFATYEEALEYGDAVRAFVCERLKALHEAGANPFGYQQDVVIQPRCREVKGTSHQLATMINLAHLGNADFGAKSLAEGLKHLQNHRDYSYPRDAKAPA